ncbi:MAG: MFS transporter [Patescibacteria group bacterium]|jgi:MFS family permease
MLKNKKIFSLIYLFSFLWAFSMALPSYIQSSYLEQFVDIKFVGLFVTLAMAITLAVQFFYPRVIKELTNYWTSMLLIIIYIVSTFTLAYLNNWQSVLVFFVIYFVCLNLFSVNLDVFLEDISDNRHAGQIRTTFLTVANCAWVLAPAVMGILARGDNYGIIYIISSFVVIPMIFILFISRRHMSDKMKYKNRNFKQLLAVFERNKNIREVFQVAFVLRFFYCIMVLYAPIYLHKYIGFNWSQIGVMFTIMLMPFVIFQMPAGKIADKYIGEKEIMVVGLLIMMAATGSIFFITSSSFFVWIAILFMTRVGASLVEAMQDVYFFKQIDGHDMDLIDLFRNVRPFAWLLGPLFAIIVLEIFPVQFLFLFLAIVILMGLRPALLLEDTK